MTDHGAISELLRASYNQLPESLVSVSEDSTVYAQYAQPTSRYRHGILGDEIEAGQLVVLRDGVAFAHTLDEQHVFEDLRPRLIDVDGDGQVEIVAIRSHVARGAGIAIYKIEGDGLAEFAWVPEIGASSRWLNIAAIYDLDSDGAMELAWVETPHIGGILRVARISRGELTPLAEASGYSNHAIGERNLCLSAVTLDGSGTTLWVPTQDRAQIAGHQFTGDALLGSGIVDLEVDFSRALASQHPFAGIVQGGDDCVNP